MYKWFVAREKSLYHSLNNMRQGAGTYIGFFWAPIADEEKIRGDLSQYPTTNFKRFNNHTIKPPTYLKTNEFTAAFQQIVNTYGIPMYKEANPGVFACISFPFLFGVMFADMGHGFLILLTGTILVLFNDRFKGTPLEAAGFARYLLFLMGISAFYNGMIYNEAFAIPLDLYGSCYNVHQPVGKPAYFPRKSFDCVYTFGVDPVWANSSQYLTYVNNLKMKLAVILGVL